MFGQKLDLQKARALYRAMQGETVALTRAAALAVDVNFIEDADKAVVAGQSAKALAILRGEGGGGRVLQAGAKVYIVQPGALWAKVRAGDRTGWVMVDAFPKQ